MVSKGLRGDFMPSYTELRCVVVSLNKHLNPMFYTACSMLVFIHSYMSVNYLALILQSFLNLTKLSIKHKYILFFPYSHFQSSSVCHVGGKPIACGSIFGYFANNALNLS